MENPCYNELMPTKNKGGRPRKLSQVQIDEMRRLFEAGLSLAELAVKYSVSVWTVTRYCTGNPEAEGIGNKEVA